MGTKGDLVEAVGIEVKLRTIGQMTAGVWMCISNTNHDFPKAEEGKS